MTAKNDLTLLQLRLYCGHKIELCWFYEFLQGIDISNPHFLTLQLYITHIVLYHSLLRICLSKIYQIVITYLLLTMCMATHHNHVCHIFLAVLLVYAVYLWTVVILALHRPYIITLIRECLGGIFSHSTVY